MNYYIHIPFCRSKCGYCAFYSEPGADSSLVERYLEKIIRQLSEQKFPEAETIYFGGGTPTLLSSCQLEKLFAAVEENLRPEKDCEISIECNPETLDAEKTALMKNVITRISCGIQSFDPALRSTLGRDCSDSAIEKAVSLIQDARIKHFNCDLIYAIPGQTLSGWEHDLETAVSCQVDHLSCYNLTPEEQSRLGGSFIIDDDAALEMYQTAGSILADKGFSRYEISNYARSGCECRHNINIWKGGKLTAFGPAGAGFDGTSRIINVENLCSWLNDGAPEIDTLDENARSREIFAVNLRTAAGWNRKLWHDTRRAVSWENMCDIFDNAVRDIPENFYSRTAESIRLTPDGLLYWNDIAEKIIL